MLLPLAFSQRELKPSRPDPISLSKTSGSTTCLENSEKRDKTRKVLGCVLGLQGRREEGHPLSLIHNFTRYFQVRLSSPGTEFSFPIPSLFLSLTTACVDTSGGVVLLQASSPFHCHGDSAPLQSQDCRLVLPTLPGQWSRDVCLLYAMFVYCARGRLKDGW